MAATMVTSIPVSSSENLVSNVSQEDDEKFLYGDNSGIHLCAFVNNFYASPLSDDSKLRKLILISNVFFFENGHYFDYFYKKQPSSIQSVVLLLTFLI